jgi:hypothetical protein
LRYGARMWASSSRRRAVFAAIGASAVVILSCFSAPAAHADSPPPFTFTGWQLHEFNLPKLEDAIKRAPSYGVNFLIFSHELFRSVEGFLASDDQVDPANPPASARDLRRGENFRIIPGWKSDLRRLGDLATQNGLPYYLWVHEFDDLPTRLLKDGRVAMDDPQLYAYLQQRYERLLDAMPGSAGFVLTLHESDLKVFRHADVATTADVPERIYRVAKLLYDVLKRRGKQLIVRNFFYEPLEMQQFKQGVDRLPDDVIVMSKDTTHEFHPFYPWDPLHGQMGKKRQIIETDLGVEKAWSSHGAYAQADYIRRVAVRAREKHVTGMVGRARLMWEQPFVDMHEVNLYAFAKFARDPDLTTERVLAEWAGRRFPARAVPFVVSALKRSEFINHYGRWHLEYWFTKELGDAWGDYSYVYSRVLQRSRFKWSKTRTDQYLEEKLYHPDDETFRRAVKEKDLVVAQAEGALDDLRAAGRYVTAAQLAPLREDFRFLLDAALLQREWVAAYFAHRRFVDDPKPEYRRTMEEALHKLESIEHTPGVTYGLDPKTGRRYNIDDFAQALRRRSADLRAARAEDSRILALTRAAADAENR